MSEQHRTQATPAPPRRVQVFANDFVRCGMNLGIVRTTYNDDDENSESEEDILQDLQPGDVRVARFGNDGYDTVKETSVTVLSRQFSPGDVVALTTRCSAEEQIGTVLNVRSYADIVPLVELQKLQTETRPMFLNAVISSEQEVPKMTRHVDARRLSFVSKYDSGNVLFKDDKLHVVQHCKKSFFVFFFTDGAICQVTPDDDHFDVIQPDNVLFIPDTVYPGLIVQAELQTWQAARWLKGTFNRSRRVGLVVDQSFSDFVCEKRSIDAVLAPDAAGKEYDVVHNVDDYMCSDLFEHADMQPGDIVLVTRHPDGTPNGYHVTSNGIAFGNRPAFFVQVQNEPAAQISTARASESLLDFWNRRLFAQIDTDMSFSHIQVVVKTKIEVDVQWQDGTFAYGLDSTKLSSVLNIDDFDFFPGCMVKRRFSEDDDKRFSVYDCGFVLSVAAKDRMAQVQWMSNGAIFFEKSYVESVSVYELDTHMWDRCLGDAIIRVDASAEVIPSEDQRVLCEQMLRSSCAYHMPPLANSPEAIAQKSNNQLDAWQRTDVTPWCGTICGILPDGLFLVLWHNHTYSLMRPEGLVSFTMDDDDEDEDEEAEEDGEYEENDDDDWESIDSDDEITEEMTSSTPPIDDVMDENTDPIVLPEEKPLITAAMTHTITTTTATTTTIGFEAAKLVKAFEQLDHVPANHHFASEHVSGLGQKSRRRRIMQEYMTLSTSLPQGIFIRTYEDNSDVMRCLMMGAAGTPYQDVLFWFDLLLPAEYPHEPPRCYFYSLTDGMGRLNPNLYEDGKVCLSLLNTWMGEGVEVWTKDSSLLQLLISLQGLVLVKYPYFNEAGYDRQRDTTEGIANAIAYNERAFMLSMKTVVNMLRRPPTGLENDVREYYIKGGVLQALIQRCENLIQDRQDCAAIFGEEGVVVNVSVGCKHVLQGIVQAMRTLMSS